MKNSIKIIVIGASIKMYAVKRIKLLVLIFHKKRLDYLASMIYGKPTQVLKVLKEGDTSQCS